MSNVMDALSQLHNLGAFNASLFTLAQLASLGSRAPILELTFVSDLERTHE